MNNKIKLTYGIGITGHTNVESVVVQPSLHLILTSIHEQYLLLIKEFSECFEKGGLQLNSCLAMGSDQIAAREALNLGFHLNAFLPFDLKDERTSLVYPKDIQSDYISTLNIILKKADSVLELSDYGVLYTQEKEQIIRHEAFRAASLTMLNNSDILIAVWNGKESETIGGTYQTIQEAIKQHKFIITISSAFQQQIAYYDYEKKLFKKTTVSELTVLVHNFILSITPAPDKCISVLKEINLSDKKAPFWAKWNSWYNWLSPKIKKQSTVVNSNKVELPKNELSDLLDRLDSISSYYAALFRTFFVLAPIIGLATVTLSALGLVFSNATIIFILSFLSLVLLLSYWSLYLVKDRYSWHKKLTEYRTMAETLRTQIYLLQIGQTSLDTNFSGIYDLSPYKWQQDLIRMFVRGQGIPQRLNWNNDKKRIKQLLHTWIEEQINYHENNSTRSSVANERLHKWSLNLFFLTVLLVILNSVISLPNDFSNLFILALPVVLGVLGILIPLYATGIDAISKYAEFSLLAERSHGLSKTLKKYLKEIDSEDQFEKISELSSSCGKLMLVETLEWNIHYRRIEISK